MTDRERCTDLSQWLFERIAQYKRDWLINPHKPITVTMNGEMFRTLNINGRPEMNGNKLIVSRLAPPDSVVLSFSVCPVERHCYTSGDLGVQLDAIEQDMASSE